MKGIGRSLAMIRPNCMTETNELLPPMKVGALIIAEDNSFRTSLARVFEEENYMVLSARDDEEGVYLLKCALVDVVIFDLDREGVCSLPLIKRLTEINRFVPMIVLANTIDGNPINPGWLVDAVIFKPVDIANLIRTADRFVSESRKIRLPRICGDDRA